MTNILEKQISKCVEFIENASYISALTGAGISTNAGIPDFRGPQGLYVTKAYDPDTVFDIDYFMRDPKPFYDFTRDFVNLEKTIKPTFAHHFLKDLEDMGKLKGVITQNIDALHKRAGSRNVLDLHGSYWKSFCLDCGKEYTYEKMKEKIFQEKIPRCACGGLIKPDVVFFGENVKYINEAFALAAEADLFFVIGTSCVVYPAAGIPTVTKGKIIIVNKGRINLPLSNVALTIQDDIDEFFKNVSRSLKERVKVA